MLETVLYAYAVTVWLPGSETANITSATTQFWYGNDLTWSVAARVDGQTYSLFGVTATNSDAKAASLLNASYTSTHSIFTLSAGSTIFTLDFLSPVSFSSYVRQSLPFSYLSVTASPTSSGTTPSIDVFSAIDERWTGQDIGASCTYYQSGNASIHQLSANGATYSQSTNEMALWGQVVYAADNEAGYSLSSGSATAERLYDQFVSNGTLNGKTGSCVEDGLHGFAYTLGSISEATTVRFASGVVREAAVNYLGEAQTHYYRSEYSDIGSTVVHFFDDYETAASEADTLDSTIQMTATTLAGQNYTDILALSTRQVMGAIDVTIPESTLSTSNVKAFIKEISSDGNVNTVDIIFPLFPFFYVFAPDYIKLLLMPILDYLVSGRYPNPWVIHDMGADYPNATGHDLGLDERMPIEETGNLFVLLLAYEKATGDTSFVSEYSSLYPGYGTYLAENGLYPVYQLSTTDGLGAFANMTSLAVKAAVGLAAYGKLSGQENYTALSASFAETILTPGVGVFISEETNEPYLDLTYDEATWYLTFNIYPDALFELDVFNASTYAAQSAFYPTVRSTLGVAIDGAVQWGKTDWDFWVAAVAEDSTLQMFVDDVHAYISNGLNTEPFSDRYYVAGDYIGQAVFRARPTVGAHWAVWAIQKGPNSGGVGDYY